MDWLIGLYHALLVPFGIGLVIFVHELGHFLAARRCGVRVETFSLGFGPRVFGWKRGETTYQLALVPLGGFVQMKGEGGPKEEGAPGEPDDLRSKSVGARFLIFSGGVLMNLAFALLVFPIIFSVGVPFESPTLGAPVPGSAAWKAGLETGMRVLEVDGEEVRGYTDIPTAVALHAPAASTLTVRTPEGEVRRIALQPEWRADLGLFEAGLREWRDPRGTLVVRPGSAAEAAGLASGDRLVEVVGAPEGVELEQAIEDRLRRGEPLLLVVESGADGSAPAARRQVELTARSVEVHVERRNFLQRQLARLSGDEREVVDAPMAGIEPAHNAVLAVRDVDALRGLDLQPGDRLRSVQGAPVLLPLDLARRLAEASLPAPVRFEIERGATVVESRLDLDRDAARRLVEAIAIGGAAEHDRVLANPGGAAARAGLADGDRVVKIGEARIERFSDMATAIKNAGSEPRIWTLMRGAPDGRESEVQIEVAAGGFARPDLGLAFEGAEHIVRADGPIDAIAIGLSSSWRFLVETGRVLKGLFQGSVAGSNVGGILTIGAVSHTFAESGLAKFFFFLCILSLNLAVLNILPIPVLDGGHLFFLLVEKLKGSPVSERVMGWSQTVGVVLVVSLMVYVTYNDLVRYLFR
jgi:regulator of sigma E protease